jgi:hypothetical protein
LWAARTIPATINRGDATSPKMAAGLSRNTTFSHRMLRAMEMIGSAEVMIDWTGASDLPCWKAYWLNR